MPTTTSRDGTTIAFDRIGQGGPLILVVGAFNDRTAGAPVADFLAPRFSTFIYDRRGRGGSGDTPPYAVEREIEDLAALIDAAGGSAAVFGYSSGAMLALQATARGLPITRLALYDPPYVVDRSHLPPPVDHAARLAELIAAGRRGDAVEYFQRQLVGLPEDVIVQVRGAPFRPALERIAQTLVYDATILGDQSIPSALAASIATPTLVIAGGAGPHFMRQSAEALADALPHGEVCILEDQSHELVPAVLGPVLEAFFPR